jgi:hypothetical protein
LSTSRFAVDEALLASAAGRLRPLPGLRFVLGGSGSGKSTVCTWLREHGRGVTTIDLDARLYGSWSDRWRPGRHPVALAWLASDALPWQLAMEPGEFVSFQAALAAEALDLLADDLASDTSASEAGLLLVDGGFGSVGVVARAMEAEPLLVLAAPDGTTAAETWTSNAYRRAFLDDVGAIETVDDPVGRFLALDAALDAAMVADAEAAAIPVVRRGPGEVVEATARSVAARLGIPVD